jgi:putative transposase
MEQVVEWQNRPLNVVYLIVCMDGIQLNIRQNKCVQKKSVYLALGINLDGEKGLLGLRINDTEGAKFWLNVLTKLKNPGLEQMLLACVDGLTGFHDAINAAYPDAKIQLCIVHMVRNSLRLVTWKDYKAVTADLAIQAASKKWTMPIRNWKPAVNHFMIQFEEQLAAHM